MSTAFSVLYAELASRLNDTGSTAIWTVTRRKQFVNGAIRHFNDLGGFQETIDETLTVVADQTTYSLPSAITKPSQVISVWVEQDSASDPWKEYVRYRINASGATCKLYLFESLSETVGSNIRVIYKAPHAELSGDTDATNVPSEFIYSYGAFLAHNEAAGNASQANRQFHLEEAKRNFDIANATLPFILPKHPPVRTIPAEARLADA